MKDTPTFFRGYKNWYDLFVKMARLLCVLRPVLGQNCNLVLVLSTHLPLFGHIFSCEIKKKPKHFQDGFWPWLKPWCPTSAGPLVGWDSPLWYSCLPSGVERLQAFLRSRFLSLLPSFSFPFYKRTSRNFLFAASPIVPIFWPRLLSHSVSEPFDGKL